MNKTRKLASLVLAMLLVLCMVVPAAAGTNDNSGSVTISNAVVGQTYTIYQILTLESYSGVGETADEDGNYSGGQFAYKATTAWKSFVESEAIKDKYLATDNQGYVTWVTNADAAAFAKLAQAWAKENSIDNQGSVTASTATVKFENLNLGYYLVDSTLGTLCSLDTTNPSVTIKEKNQAPTVTKDVQEDSDSSWGDTNDADIGQNVNFKATITVQAGAENYTLHDTMSEGLTYNKDVVVKVGDTTVDTSNYTVSESATDGCTFEVKFNNDYIAKLTAGTQIVVTYSAKVNESAVVGLDGNDNTLYLEYGDENHTTKTPEDKTITYTWDLDVLKYANGKEADVLKDAQFVLIKKVTEGESTKELVATVVNGKVTGWVDVPTAVDGTITWPANTTLATNASGKIEIDGLDADTYYLREIKAPDGYNKLASDVEVKITGATKGEEDKLTYTTVVAKVNNQSGTELPSTGGMGTTLFYVVGGVLVVAAFLLLVTKRRVGAEK